MAASSVPGVRAPRLARGYAVYCLAILAFLILVGLLEQVGVPAHHIGWLVGTLPLVVFSGIGLASRTMQAGEFYVAGRTVSPGLNALATAADWLSAASFLGIAGALYAQGDSALAYVIGSTGGFVLIAVLIAPYLRKSGAYTVPDFLALRFGGVVRAPAAAVLACCSFPLFVVQIQAFGLIAARVLAVPYAYAADAGVVVIVASVLLGGMRGLTRVQAAQYLLLAFAFLLTPVLVSSITYGVPLPVLTVGEALTDAASLGGAAAASPGGSGAFGDFALIFCLACGTASMPHLLMRFLTVRTVRDARGSAGWALVFASLVLLAAPAYAAYFRLGVAAGLMGADVDGLPDWLLAFGRTGVMKVCGAFAATPEMLQSTCEAVRGVGATVQPGDITMEKEAVVLATPEVSGFPFVVTALLATGGLAAALASAGGLALAIANTLSHDLWYKIVDRRAPTGRRLLAARLAILVVAVAGGTAATAPAGDLLGAMVCACALAAAGFFPAIVLGIWWRRCNTVGALCGMAAGIAVVLLWLAAHAALLPPAGTDTKAAIAAAATACVLAVVCGFAACVVVSLITPRPRNETQLVIDALRFPRGEPLLTDRPV